MKKLWRTLLFSSLLAGGVIGVSGCDNGPKIGILQPVEHVALSNAREGFMEAIKEAGLKYKFNYMNANGDEASLNTMSKSLVNSSVITLGIGTGASLALKSAAQNAGSDKPILFTAVTDPEGAKLVASNDAPGGQITGASDMNPVVDQINLIKECLPSATKIGIFYTQSETNSQVQANQARDAAIAQGLEVAVATCTDSSDINVTVNNLCSSQGIQALYIPTDNNVAAHMQGVKNAAEANHVLVIGGEEGIVKNGGHITLSISYKELGRRTGEMAVKILKDGVKPSELPVLHMTAEECTYVMSSENLTAAGIELPQSIKDKCTDISSN